MDDVIVQQETQSTSYNCKDILDGVCLLKAFVEGFFNARQFNHEELADMFPCNYQLRIVNAATSIPDNLALPTIAMSRSDINFGVKVPMSAEYGTVVAPMFTLNFEIKTPNYRMTEYMAVELSQFLLSYRPYIRSFNLYLAGVVCGETKQFRDSTPNYYFSKVSVNASVPPALWTYPNNGSILRSISLSLRMHIGDATREQPLT